MKKTNTRLPLRWLALAVVVTTLLGTATLSRYATTVSGTGTAQTAAFDVKMTATGSAAINENWDVVTDTATDTYTLTLTSNSDVDVAYTVGLQFTEAVPAGISFAVDGHSMTTQDRLLFTCSEGFTYNVADKGQEKSHTLTVTADYTNENFTGDFAAEDAKVVITAEQKS